MTHTLRTLACLLALTVAPAALAQDQPPVARDEVPADRRMAMQVHAQAFRMVEKLLEPQMTLRMALVARQKAAAVTCEGFAVDDARFGKVMAGALEKLTSLTAAGENNLPFDVAMYAYFTMFGGELAIAALDTAAYCTAAEALRTELADDTEGLVLVWNTAP
jgi:hypothetical protein